MTFQAVTASGKNGPKVHKKTNYLLFDMEKNITRVKDRGFFSDILEKYEELGDIRIKKPLISKSGKVVGSAFKGKAPVT